MSLRGTPDPATGMMVDLGLLERSIAEVRKTLDHRLLNNVDELGLPTLENLARFIWERFQHAGSDRPRHRAPRKLRQDMHLFRAASVG